MTPLALRPKRGPSAVPRIRTVTPPTPTFTAAAAAAATAGQEALSMHHHTRARRSRRLDLRLLSCTPWACRVPPGNAPWWNEGEERASGAELSEVTLRAVGSLTPFARGSIVSRVEHGLVGIPWTEISTTYCFFSRRPPWRRAVMPKRTADVSMTKLLHPQQKYLLLTHYHPQNSISSLPHALPYCLKPLRS